MKREIIFDLKAGSLVSMIDPAKHNINRYAVRTPKGLAKAQGTSFTTSVTGEDMTVATTADSVSFTTPAGVTYTVNAGNVTESTAGGSAQERPSPCRRKWPPIPRSPRWCRPP